MKQYNLISILIFILLLHMGIQAQEPTITIAGQKIPARSFQIIIPISPSAVIEHKAGVELQKYLEKITGIKIPIQIESEKMRPAEFIIGHSNRFPSSIDLSGLGPDGFIIRTTGTKICIGGGTHKGTLYGVYEFLERYLDCRFWAPDAETVPATTNIVLPVIDQRENPAFDSRETYYAGMANQTFADKMRCDRNAWKGAENWGMWVHTMFTFIPPEKYFDSHPEYFAQMAGKRVRTQLCLSNPDVLKITIDELGKRMKEKPGAKYWSVSQMDTYGWCECPACKAIDEREGSPSGSMIEFVNKVAEAFPDRVISTLAYQYTRSAPKHIKPAPNVNIMLCTIECDRSKPIESDTSANSFLHDIQSWSAIASDILVWDYVIQFTNMIAPFPNLRILQPNIQMFRRYHAKSLFEQGCHGTYSENQELRQYMIAKLLWNPDLDMDSLENIFLNGYYGKAAPYIRNYISMMEDALKKSGKTLWIYGSPMQETDAFLGTEQIQMYNTFFDSAALAVSGDSILTARVEKARLPLRYAILEVAKRYITGPWGFLEPNGSSMVPRKDILKTLTDFVTLANQYGVTTIHERNLPPDEYGKTTAHFFRNAYAEHLAKGKPYFLETEPSRKYAADGTGSLTDGKRGSSNYYVLWQGFEATHLTAVVDLGRITPINYVGAEFLQDLTSWIFYPEKVVISISEDGKNYKEVAFFDGLSFDDLVVIHETGKMIPLTMARYVRFWAQNIEKCPEWHIGHGGKAWLFSDELIVDKR